MNRFDKIIEDFQPDELDATNGPTAQAWHTANLALDVLDAVGITPSRIAPTVEAGIFIQANLPLGVLVITIHPDGSMTTLP